MDGVRLAVLTAFGKSFNAELKEIQEEAKSELSEAYRLEGTKNKAIRIGDQTVGNVSMSERAAGPVIVDEDYALDFFAENGLLESHPIKGWEKLFALRDGRVIYKPTGEVCDWAEWRGKTEGYPRITGCKPDEVAMALQAIGAPLDPFAYIGGNDEHIGGAGLLPAES